MSCNVVVVGDSALGVQGVVHLLPKNANLVGSYSDLKFTAERIESLNPDVVIVTLVQPSLNWATSFLNLVARLGSRVVLLSQENSSAPWASVKTLPIHGLSAERISGLLATIVVSGRHEQHAVAIPPETKITATEILSSREIEVLSLVARGFSTKEIATHLRISTRTVDFHRANIQHKTRLKSVAALTRFAIEHEIVEIGTVKDLVA